ncbi:type II toxin-antitoxin system VapC family toxin [Sphingomonas floccifaciens]|uniref:Type II toxin-antitoxin system VapC family toxin n=1 Tax=Sphingomonas floccifaciens TaxID=1844115 RepID=A0ABW4NDE3_9SPHN
MTIFVDASAIIAMIAGEPEGNGFALAIRADGDAIWSAVACWEAVRGLHKAKDISFDAARREVEALAVAMPFRLVDIGDEERDMALVAYERYGKGRHDAKLNMGDCFAYACARTNGAKLLYKGDDFSKTDLA